MYPMNKWSCVTITSAALLLVAWRPTRSAQDDPAPVVPPEMKVLKKRVGSWTTVTRGKAAEWTREGFESKGDEKIDLVMHGRFIQGKVRSQPGDVEAVWLATYDPARKAYRFWYFSSQGAADEGTGRWDPKTKTLTWTSELKQGVTSTSHWRFVADDTFEWDLAARGRDGKVYLDMVGKLTRKR
jgi:hypothetical protein